MKRPKQMDNKTKPVNIATVLVDFEKRLRNVEQLGAQRDEAMHRVAFLTGRLEERINHHIQDGERHYDEDFYEAEEREREACDQAQQDLRAEDAGYGECEAKEITVLRKQRDELKREYDKAQEERAALQAKVYEMQHNHAQAIGERDDATKQIATLKETLNRVCAERADLQLRNKQIFENGLSLERERDDVKSRLLAAEKTIDNLNAENNRLDKTCDDIQQAFNANVKALNVAKENARVANAKLAMTQRENERIKHELDEANRLNGSARVAINDRGALQAHIAKLNKTLLAYNDALRSAHSTAKSYAEKGFAVNWHGLVDVLYAVLNEHHPMYLAAMNGEHEAACECVIEMATFRQPGAKCDHCGKVITKGGAM